MHPHSSSFRRNKVRVEEFAKPLSRRDAGAQRTTKIGSPLFAIAGFNSG